MFENINQFSRRTKKALLVGADFIALKSPDTSYTECFCHNSIFDPTRGAKVLAGPAPIPLAQIGIKVKDDGTLAFTSDFTGPIGPQV